MVVYRLWDQQEQKFVASGRSLYSTNGRTLWVGKSGAVNTKKNLHDDVRERVELVTYELVEIAREESDLLIDQVVRHLRPLAEIEIETGDLHGDH